MSITVETAQAHANDPAVTCCRFEAGTVVEPANLEDPAIFPDLVESGLLVLPENTLTIGQVLGAKLTATCDALTALTPENAEGFSAGEEAAAEEEVVEEAPVAEAAPAAVAPVAAPAVAGGVFKLHIGEGKDINLEIPLGAMGGAAAPAAVAPVAVAEAAVPAVEEAKKEEKTTLIRSLTKKHFKIDKVVFGEETKIEGTTLTLRTPEDLCKEAVDTEELVYDMKLEIITPDRYN